MEGELNSARALIQDGDPQGAFRILSGLLRYPATFDPESEFARAMAVFAEAALKAGGTDLSKVLLAVAKKPGDPKALYDAGYALYEEGLPSISATVLHRAHNIDPRSVEIALELSVAFEDMTLNGDALRVLRATGAEDDFPIVAYLVGFHGLMTGDVKGARARVAQLQAIDDPQIKPMAETLDSMLLRTEAIGKKVSLEGTALTAWHAALNGCLLLHESPSGYEDPMHGRYAFVVESPALMKEGIVLLGDTLKRADRKPSRVVAATDRASQVLGLAASKALGLPFESWSGEAPKDALVVIWCVEALEDGGILETMSERHGQVLWIHATKWTEPLYYAPDVTTYLCEQVYHPYLQGPLGVGGEPTKETGPDPRTNEELAEEILAAEVEDGSAADPLVLEKVLDATHGLAGDAQLGIRSQTGRRAIQRRGGPVTSSRFN